VLTDVERRLQRVTLMPLLSLALCLVGLGLAGYLTVEHFAGSSTLACPDTGIVNCLKVTTSSYSSLFGIPVALLGLLFFAAMTPLCAPMAWRSTNPLVHRARLAVAGIGVAFVVYLVAVELFAVDAICLWCTAVHITTVTLFAMVAVGSALRPGGSSR
jgi:uncharacterized membrane protein